MFFNLSPHADRKVIRAEVITKLKGFQLEKKSVEVVAYHVIEGDIFNPELIDRQIVHFGNYEPFYKYKVEIQITLPALSYDTLFVAIDQSTDLPEVAATTKIEAENIITTNLYEVTVNPNGTIDLVDRCYSRTVRTTGMSMITHHS